MKEPTGLLLLTFIFSAHIFVLCWVMGEEDFLPVVGGACGVLAVLTVLSSYIGLKIEHRAARNESKIQPHLRHLCDKRR